MGAVLLLVGLIAAAITSPIYDRVLTHHLALSCKVLCPVLGACWIALIWESACIRLRYLSPRLIANRL